jgi:hypothetical protein
VGIIYGIKLILEYYKYIPGKNSTKVIPDLCKLGTCCEVWGSAVGQSSTGCSCCWLLGSASKGKAKEMKSKGNL